MKWITLGSWFLAALTAGFSQSAETEEAPHDQPQVEEAFTVHFSAGDFRHRSEAVSPKLVYGQEFFQRFEPLSVGDILKRVSGISGSADAGEFDRPQLRGIGAEYTQILINGRRIPGSGNDRTLYVDRIPAHMVERIEINRSPSADQDAQGIAGTINIVLKDEATVQGLSVLAGASHFDHDQETKGQAAFTYGLGLGKWKTSFEASALERYNPKFQFTDLIDEEGERLFKDERNTLDSRETGFRMGSRLQMENGMRIQSELLVFATDRDTNEQASLFADGELDERIFDVGTVDQKNLGGRLALEAPQGDTGLLTLSLEYDRISLDNRAEIGVFEDDQAVVEEIETDSTEDDEIKVKLELSLGHHANHLIQLGIGLEVKNRDGEKRFFEIEEGDIETLETGGVFQIRQQRLTSYAMDHWQMNDHNQIEFGLRVEQTELEFLDTALDKSELQVFPSVHYRLTASLGNIFRASLARTIKRQNFEDLTPFRQPDQPRDGQITIGNPDLDPEPAWGLDLGFEHQFQRHQGSVGINLFYRRIEDRVERTEIEDDLFQPRNLGTGKVYGVEIDAGLPLTGLGLPNLSVFANMTLQSSRLRDPLTNQERRFNLQPSSVFNAGYIHFLPGLNATYGVNFLTQAEAEELALTEVARIEAGDNLEVFFEKRWGGRFSLRLTGRNLLDSQRSELIREYDGLRTEGDLIESGSEVEEPGRSLLLTFRGVFGARKKN